MDIGINKSFKDYCRRSFDLWCEGAAEGVKPHRRDAAAWCIDAWNRITPNIIQNT
jgi:hypothetical protein